MQAINQFLKSISSEHLFDDIKRGVEKENLRVTPNGEISPRAHPIALGAALTNTWITTDFSEALLEVVTPAVTNASLTYKQLFEVSQFVAQHIGDELIWCSSMPVELVDQKSVPLADYGNNNVGRLKKLYRQGLCRRYGRAMQIIAGIHYNFSLPDRLFEQLKAYRGSDLELQDYRSDCYMHLLRNCLRYAWLIPYLFGASPACAHSSLIQSVDYVEPLVSGGGLGATATSLRLSDLGYQNKGQELLRICYRDVNRYAESLKRATSTPFKAFSSINAANPGSLVQLNDSLLQIANEYYNPIRPKQIAKTCEQPTDALLNRGIAYVEMRMLDLNPLQPLGLCQQQMAFMDVFLTFCLLNPGEDFTADRHEEYKDNLKQVACRGRDPKLRLSIDGKQQAFYDEASRVFSQLHQVAELLDDSVNDKHYAEVVESQFKKLTEVELTPSAQLMQQLLDSKQSFQDFYLEKSGAYTKELQQTQSAMAVVLQAEAKRSLEEFKRIEAEPQQDFEGFLAKYLQGVEGCHKT